jgi:hypothetical protein
LAHGTQVSAGNVVFDRVLVMKSPGYSRPAGMIFEKKVELRHFGAAK